MHAGEAGWRAGRRAFRDKVLVHELYVRAAHRARAYVRRHKDVSSRLQCRQTFEYAYGFVDGYFCAGNEMAKASGDTALAAALQHAELEWRTLPGAEWHSIFVQL